MKKLLLTAIAASVAAVTYGQGTIFIYNVDNTGVYNGNGGSTANPVYSGSVTQNGLIFTTDSTEQAGGGSTLIGNDFSWALYGGATATTATTLLASETGSAITGDNTSANYGNLYYGANAVSVPGTTAAGTVYLELFVWEGSTFITYAAAASGGDFVGDSGVFANGSGGITASGSVVAAALTGMPDMNLAVTSVPEPGTLALAALGGASLLMFRRKK
jgi:hypothetical protein